MKRAPSLSGRRAGWLGALTLLCVGLLSAVLLSSGPGRADENAMGGSTAPALALTRTEALAPAHVPRVDVGAPAAVRPFAAGFLGVSLEYYVLGDYALRDPNVPDPAVLQLIRNLAPGERPVLRIGGDSTDWSWLPTAGVVPVGGLKVEITPRLLRLLGAFTRSLDARLVLGINLEDDSPRLAAHEADALLAAVGAAHVAALELGNEPELYAALGWYARAGRPVFGRSRPYTLADYGNDFNRLAAHLPHVALAGPASGSQRFSGPAALASFIAGAHRLRLVTVHTYPMKACGTRPGLASYPTIAKLLSPASTRGLVSALLPDVEAAHRAGRSIRVDETDSVSCFGALGVSNTFAAALWTVETALGFARTGVDGINLPTLPAARYRLWTMHGGAASVAPQYYGLLDVARAVPAGSRFLATSGGSMANLQTFAIRTPAGQTRVIVVNTGPARRIAIHIPGLTHPASATVLRAGGPAATGGVTLAGQSYGAATATGQLSGSASGVAIEPVDGAYVLALGADTATTLSIGSVAGALRAPPG